MNISPIYMDKMEALDKETNQILQAIKELI